MTFPGAGAGVITTAPGLSFRYKQVYASYDAMPEFRVGFESHPPGFHGNPHHADAVAAPAWARGLEAAARHAGEVSTSGHELNAGGARLSAETGVPDTPTASGEMVAGRYQQPLTLIPSRFAVIDNGRSIALVPSDLERHGGSTFERGRMVAFRPFASCKRATGGCFVAWRSARVRFHRPKGANKNGLR
jgi:hypothetical protein